MSDLLFAQTSGIEARNAAMIVIAMIFFRFSMNLSLLFQPNKAYFNQEYATWRLLGIVQVKY